jgi:hypothetical protein
VGPVDDDVVRQMQHVDCGAVTTGVVVCENCGEHLDRHNLRARPLLPVVAERFSRVQDG